MSYNRKKRIIDKLDQFFGVEGDHGFELITYNALNLSEIDDIIDDCFLVKRIDGYNQFLFFGENIVDHIGMGNKSSIENLLFSDDHEITERFQEVLESRKPIMTESSFINHDDEEVRYRQKLYPLLNDDGELEYIFGGIRWKIIT